MKHVLIVNLRDSFVYNIVETIRQCKNIGVRVVEVDTIKEWKFTKECCGVILSPGGGIPSEYPELLEFIDQYHTLVPMLGVCLGHQALCQYFGAELYCLDKPLHGYKENLIITEQSEIFSLDCDNNDMPIGLYHSWAVKIDSTMAIKNLATDTRGIIMAIKHKELPIYGVQFHPESYISGKFGQKTLHNWIQTL